MPAGPARKVRRKMPEMVWMLLILAGWFVLVRWVLPRLGVPT
jgi:hypothetical protein